MTGPYFEAPTMEASPAPSFQPIDRSLPDQNVSSDNITDAYVQFMLYCNPQFPLNVDITQLASNFNTPPKSDGKEFETFRLWELLKQFDAKEIKTWGQLAQELGVEPPDPAKGQSAQKVQQYTVRLKRWMRAMHIDAFFEYLLGKQHAYFCEIPDPSDPYPTAGRDGVVAEEDLAIRALDPSFRPKRGRRRNSDAGQDDDSDGRNKQARLGVQDVNMQPRSAYPRSAMPMSAHPDAAHHDPWTAVTTQQPFQHWPSAALAASHSAVTPSIPQHLRWQMPSSAMTPATPHPATALPGGGSMNSHIDAAFDAEPKSAITPSYNKRKRKHGPAVSSAWPSTTPAGGKPRGRPPGSRNSGEGLTSTFQASRLSQPSMSPGPDAIPATPEEMAPPPPQSAGGSRPGRLSLQVPQHTGRPVRLATPPPPTVIVSGEATTSNSTPEPWTVPFTGPSQSNHDKPPPPQGPRPLTYESLKRILATDLLRATLTGRSHRLSSAEAKALAESILTRLAVPRTPEPPPIPSRDFLALLTASSFLGLGDQLHAPAGAATGEKKKITVITFRTSSDGYEELVSPSEAPLSPSAAAREQTRCLFDVSWTASQGSLSGAFSLAGLEVGTLAHEERAREKRECIHDFVIESMAFAAKGAGLTLPDGEEGFKARAGRQLLQAGSTDWGDGGASGYGGNGYGKGEGEGDGIDWKARCMAMEFGGRIARGEALRFRDRVLEGMLDVLLQD